MSIFVVDNTPSDIERGESVILFPTFGRMDDDGRTWRVSVRGVVFGPGKNNFRRKLIIRVMRRLLKARRSQLESEPFTSRVAAFLTKTERGRQMAVRLADSTHILRKRSKRNGHFGGTLHVAAGELDQLRHNGQVDGGWLDFQLAMPEGDRRRFTGCAQLVSPTGISIISDIDDTIKHTQVRRRRTMLANTFLREYRPVEGMAEVFRAWADRGAVFHYVSSSPWQLYESLVQFGQATGFPAGSYHLRSVRLRDPSFFRLFLAKRRGKKRVIRSILRTFPRRRFVLIGDAGEKDPEIYGSVARKHPDQIVRILIRRLDGRPLRSGRLERAFRQLPDDLWHLFDDPAQLEDLASFDAS